MYCSTCGKSVPENLNYCSGCGARNEKNPIIVGNSSSRPFALGAVMIGVVGLIGFFPILKILIENPRLDQAAMLLVLVAYLATVFLMFTVLIGHVWKHSGNLLIKSKELDEGHEDYMSPRTFRSVNTAQLEPAGSVIENTTRTLDEVRIGRR